jgi:hypothetical protein
MQTGIDQTANDANVRYQHFGLIYQRIKFLPLFNQNCGFSLRCIYREWWYSVCKCTRVRCRAQWPRCPKGRYTLSVRLSDFTVWRHTWWKNWVNCAVLTGNSADLTTVLSSRLSHTELRSSLRESHSFLSLPADTTMSSSQGTSVSSNSFSRWTSHDIFLFKYHFLLHVLRFLFFFSDNTIADVASKQQTTALVLSTIVTRTRRHTELTKKTDKRDGKPVLCQKTFSSVFRTVFFYQLNCTV